MRSLTYITKHTLYNPLAMLFSNVTGMASQLLTDEVRAYLKEIGIKAGKAGSRTAKSIAAKRSAAKRWRLRFAKYGPSGRRMWPGYLSEKYPQSFQHRAETEQP